MHTLGKLPGEIAETTAVPCLNGRDVAERSDIVFIMVPDTPDVESALFAQHGIAAGLAEGKTVVDMSSISPIATKRFAEKIRALGCDYLDAPVSGGESAPATPRCPSWPAATRVFARVKPLFELMGKNITLVGGNGDGQTAKVANQIIVALNIQAVAEALLFAARRPGARAPGADGRLRVQQDPGSTRRAHDQAQLRPGLSHRAAPEGPEPGAVQRPRAGRVAAQHRHGPGNVQRLRRAGGKAWDHSALVRALEQLANFEIGQQA